MPGSRRLGAAVAVVRSLTRPFERPDRLPRAIVAAARWPRGIGALAAAAAARYPDAPAIVDDHGSITYAELWHRSHALAAALRESGLGEGSTVGLLGRNHRAFVESLVATALSGADLVLLNTGFAPPQLADVVRAEGIDAIVHDDEFGPIVEGCGTSQLLGDEVRRDAAAGAGRRSGRVAPPTREGRLVLLTSGTTGRPKGAARRSDVSAAEGIAGLLERVPLRIRDVQVVSAPMFHAWGLSHLALGMARSATTVVSPRFDPARTVEMIERHRARILVVVPVMLQRMLQLGADDLERRDLASLHVVASSGSALPGHVTTEWMRRVGPNLYNTYGSTEVALAAIATPDDLRRAPTTVGRPVLGATVEILDEHGAPVAPGTTGRIFVGSAGAFDGYTSGESKPSIRGLLSSGDLGHVDADGLLFVDGRDDEMVISGGENLYPAEVEDLVLSHPDVDDAAVVGVPDDEFGQALSAYVVPRPGSDLTAEDVRRHVRDHLARFKVPRDVHLVTEIPRTTSGKILHRELRAEP